MGGEGVVGVKIILIYSLHVGKRPLYVNADYYVHVLAVCIFMISLCVHLGHDINV